MAISLSLSIQETADWGSPSNFAATAVTITNPGANALIVYSLSVEAATADVLQAVTVSGGGLTWTRLGSGVAAGTYVCHSGLWWAKTTTDPGAGFTITPSGGPGFSFGVYQAAVHVASGHDASTPIGGYVVADNQPGDGAVTVTLSSAPASGDATLAGSFADIDGTTGTATFGAGTWTSTHASSATPYLATRLGYRTGSTSAAVQWADVNTGTGNNTSTQWAVVVKVASAGGTPQTWTGSTGTIKIAGSPGTFTPGAAMWSGSTGTITIAGSSGAFAPGPATWTGSTGTIAVEGMSGEFAASTIWQGSTGAIAIAGTSGAFTPGAATWPGSTGTIVVQGVSGEFVGVDAPQAWSGSTGAIAIDGSSGAFTPGTTAWAGSTGTIKVQSTSGSFAAGTATWAGSTGVVKAQATSGSFVAGTRAWAGSTGVIRVAGTSGAFVADGGPQTWTGSTGIVRVAGTSGAFVAGTKTWTGSAGTARVAGTSGAFLAGTRAWTGSTGTIRVTGTTGTWLAGPSTWAGSNGTIRVLGVGGHWTGGAPIGPTVAGGVACAFWFGDTVDMTVYADAVTSTWSRDCGTTASGYDEGDQPTIQFVFTPHSLHPLAESTALTITVERPDGTVFGTYGESDPSVTRSTASVTIGGVTTTETTYVFEFPSPLDAGSKRKPWRVKAKSTAGILAAVETSAWVKVPAVS